MRGPSLSSRVGAGKGGREKEPRLWSVRNRDSRCARQLGSHAASGSDKKQRRKITRWPREWKFSIGLACSRGNFEMVKWTMEHPLGPDACASLKDQFMFDDLLCEAAKSGSAELAGYLLDQFAHALQNAAKGGHLDCMKVLLERYSSSMYSERKPVENAVVEAAKNGHLDILKFLHVQDPPLMHPCTEQDNTSPKRRKIEAKNIWSLNLAPPNIQFWLRSKNQFDVLLFLRVNCPDIFTTEFGQEAKYDYSGDAARPGDYLIEEWLEENHPGSPTEEE
ncbi:Ankyrin repeat-containing domain [Phytophthora cactorum]|nr:Ankyrin repeat-containing domain [Phytophthora cactorum]